MENPEKGKNSEEDDGIETLIDIRTKGRIGKKTWRKIILAVAATITGSFALGDILRRALELYWH